MAPQRLHLIAALELIEVFGLLLVLCQLSVLNLNTLFQHRLSPLLVLEFLEHLFFEICARFLKEILELVRDEIVGC